MDELVFISYTRNDSDLATKLTQGLEKKGISVWLDINAMQEDSKLENGIENGLKRSTSMIVLLSESSYSSSYVRNEIEYALLNNKLQNKVLPVFITENNKIDFDKLPWILRKIQYLQIDRNEKHESSVNAIIKKYLALVKGRQ
jgi:hypothetical protein